MSSRGARSHLRVHSPPRSSPAKDAPQSPPPPPSLPPSASPSNVAQPHQVHAPAPNATCNDGSPAACYYSPATTAPNEGERLLRRRRRRRRRARRRARRVCLRRAAAAAARRELHGLCVRRRLPARLKLRLYDLLLATSAWSSSHRRRAPPMRASRFASSTMRSTARRARLRLPQRPAAARRTRIGSRGSRASRACRRWRRGGSPLYCASSACARRRRRLGLRRVCRARDAVVATDAAISLARPPRTPSACRPRSASGRARASTARRPRRRRRRRRPAPPRSAPGAPRARRAPISSSAAFHALDPKRRLEFGRELQLSTAAPRCCASTGSRRAAQAEAVAGVRLSSARQVRLVRAEVGDERGVERRLRRVVGRRRRRHRAICDDLARRSAFFRRSSACPQAGAGGLGG